jgi:hypothetical protein
MISKLIEGGVSRPTVFLERQIGGGPQGTIGQVYTSDALLYSVELPWLKNERDISCIPSGIYRTEKHMWSVTSQVVPRLTNVPDREYILIHPGNYLSEIKGCILLGTSVGMKNGQFFAKNSREAFRRFKNSVGYEFNLIISTVHKLPPSMISLLGDNNADH